MHFSLRGHHKDASGVAEHESEEPTQIISIDDIAKRKDLTLYEKKCILVNRQVDAMGLGRYQYCLIGLCGLGYLIDLLWAQIFGLVLQPLKQEFNFTGSQQSNISVCFSAGLTAGAAFWGIVVDLIGRWWSFNLTVLCSSVFGLALGGSNDFKTFLVLTAFVGFGVGGNIPIDTTITLEMIPQNKRRALPFLSIFQPVGVVLSTAFAYAFIPRYSCEPNFLATEPLVSCNTPNAPTPCCGKANNMGWRYALLCTGAMTCLIFILRFVVFDFQESPKFLLYRGKDEKAAKVLQNVCKFNRQPCHVTFDSFERLTKAHEAEHGSSDAIELGAGSKQKNATATQKVKLELSRFKILFASWKMARTTILIALTYICDVFGFTVAGFYLPTIVALKNASLDLSLQFTYASYFAIYAPGIVGVLLGVFCYDLPGFGRKWTMVVSSGLMGASLFIFSTVTTEASNIGLNCMEYFFQSMFNAVLYGFTPEVFPAPIRGTASGFNSFLGRLFGIIGPLVAGGLLPPTPGIADYNKTLYLSGGVTLGCVLFLSLLPNDIVGKESM